MEVRRAYALFDLKSVDAERRLIEGLASTPATDRDGDVLEPGGAQFTLPMPLLWQHKHDQPIGEVIAARVTDAGIWIKAQIAKDVLPEIDRAWALIKSRLVRGFSVGFLPVGIPERIQGGGYRFTQWTWYETSAVTIPANQQASIALIKSSDHDALAATGTQGRGLPKHPAVSGQEKACSAMTVSEQISSAKSELKTKSARLEELIIQQTADGGLSPEEESELDATTTAVEGLNKRVTQLSVLEGAQAAQAKAIKIAPSVSSDDGKPAPKATVRNLEKGTLFTRYAMAVAAGKGSFSDTLAYAKQFTNTPEVAAYVKYFKAVEGTSYQQSPGWGSELVSPDTAMTEFVELLMPETILGKVSGFRRVPFNIPIITQTGGSTFGWVGEGNPKPVGELAFDRTTMGYTKCAGIIVMTEELVRLSNPNAESTARRDMIEQCAAFLDEQFIQVGVTAGANNPASITNNVSSPAASGTDAESLKLDLQTALNTFTAAKIPLSGLVIVTTPELALGISLLTNPLGQTPTGFAVNPNGGTLLGYPVVVSNSVDPGTLVVFKPSEIFLADDGQVRLDASNQATLDMNGTSTPVFSLWQKNCVALRAERWINWQKRREDVVAVIDTAAYGPSSGSV